ncbi:hypothetical protein ITJ38_13945 [Agreia pratensis]|uniref:Uncharacterized protein n=1 Tax=Agreia pratensis TaxID=150121 RepID=A0A1X7JU40_9MICO|nr:hypothetical protein [Agreia pratensis]MBF4635513.1 hypothetical protein [Agreia pratensis]SMG31609.1 hypothetical protein SAMN06296010_1822 [Agreia pratensis]
MAFRVAAVIWTAIALAVIAIVHFSLAPQFDLVQTRLEGGFVATVGQLFRVAAVSSAVLAVLILVRPRRWSALVVAAASAAGLALTVASTVMPIELPFGLPTIPVGPWLQLRILAAGAEIFAVVGSLMIAGRRRR